MTTAEQITAECNAIKGMLLAKNAAYGDSALSKLSRVATMGPEPTIEDTVADLIGYLVLLRIAQRRASHGEVVDDEFEPWQSAVPEQDVRRREHAAHGVGYIIPQMEDGDDDPIVHVVPDRTSRATLPDECLGARCGRVRG